MTGVKIEGRVPKIIDDRPDTKVNIIVLDLRDNQDINNSNENQPASKFKKMPMDIWENVLQIGMAYTPNQLTDCPIQVTIPSIDVFSNILPSPQQQAQQQNPMLFNPGMFNPGMMFGGNNGFMMGQPSTMYNNPHANYVNVMAAAQSLLNANSFPGIYNPATFNNQRILSPQLHQQQLMIPQQQLQLQQQQQIQHQQLQQQQLQKQQQLQLQQQQQQQIKRKPVQSPHPQYISPQIEQRLLRKKTIPPPATPLKNSLAVYSRDLPAMHLVKKKVTFAEEPIIFEYEVLEPEPDSEEGREQIEQVDEEYYDQKQHYYPEDEVEQHRHHQYNNEAYYTQQDHYHNRYQRLEPERRRPHDYHNGEEDHGELWGRRNYIDRNNSMGSQ